MADIIIELFNKLINDPDADLQFSFENLNTSMKFLDIKLKTADKILNFDIYHKPINSFSFHYRHIKKIIYLALAKRFVRMVSETGDERQ